MNWMQYVRARHKMRYSFHFSAPLLFLLFFTLLCPRNVATYPYSPTAPMPMVDVVDVPELQAALLHIRAALDYPISDWLVQLPEWVQDPWQSLLGPWNEDVLMRAQRGDLVAKPLSPFPGGHSLESLHYQEGGEDGGKRNEALTSFAGGLQAVSREKGGFGFRFGRKRWTDRAQLNKGSGA